MLKALSLQCIGILAAQADIGDNVKILDPNDPNGKNVLTGATAKAELAKNSILFTGYAPTGFDVSLRAMNDSINNSATNPDLDSVGIISTSTRAESCPQPEGILRFTKWHYLKSEVQGRLL